VKVHSQTSEQTADTNGKQNKDNLTVQLNQLKTMYNVSESKLKNLTEENQNLKTQNQELEAQRNNLTQQIEKEETEWNELNVTRAQWSIDAYCPIERDKRHCNACQAGWLNYTSSCYAINNAVHDEQKNWREAQENCRGKASDLVVVVDEKEKVKRKLGYWIGLRVEDGRWKWVDGSDLTKESWIARPEKDHCAISVLKDRGWKSVSCRRFYCRALVLDCTSFTLVDLINLQLTVSVTLMLFKRSNVIVSFFFLGNVF
uniref:Asialoglycoprotein receptor 1-like n=1 Tax=Seriola lalandi dorsalis TaxID=1841481 RepID=A0A3B4Y175_SERLL